MFLFLSATCVNLPLHHTGQTCNAYLCGQLHVIRSYNGTNEGFQLRLCTPEQRLVIALVLIVLLGWLRSKDWMTVVPLKVSHSLCCMMM